MVSALRFKGEKKVKKRKRAAAADNDDPASAADGGDGDGEASASKKVSTAPKKEFDSDEEGWIDSEVIGARALPRPAPTIANAPADDLTGPLLICLGTTPPTCLASDFQGAVYASPLADDLASAEPADVQQVWVCARVYGSATFFSPLNRRVDTMVMI